MQLELRASGLYLDPSPHSDVPPGALVEASDVVIRRAGIIEPRPGLQSVDVSDISSSYRVVGIEAFKGALFYIARDQSTPTTTKVANATGTVQLGGSDLTFARDYCAREAVGDALYFATTAGLVAVDTATDVTARLAGMPRGRSGYCTLIDGPQTDDQWLEAGDGTVAYRVLFATEVQGRLIVGAPSGRFYATSSAGDDKAVRLRIPLGGELIAGDRLEVYRSEVSDSNTPSDELALALTYTLVAADISAGYVDLDDLTPENKRGAALYTNATQAGATQEHARPPVSKTLCDHGEMLFFGDTTTPSRLTLGFTHDPSEEPGPPGNFTADFTGASATITNASWADDEDYLGMAVCGSGGPRVDDVLFADTYLAESLGSSQWTISAAADASATTEAVTLADWALLSDGTTTTRFYFFSSGTDDFTVGDIIADQGDDEQAIDRTLAKFAASINTIYDTITASAPGGGGLLIENVDAATGGDILMTVNRRMALRMRPPADALDSDGATADFESEQDSIAGRLMFSRLSIPEAVPPTHFVDLGRKDAAILAMESGARSLIVFKEDGIFRVTGKTPESLAVERIDQRARLLHPQASTTYRGSVYGWTRQGLVLVSDTQVADNLTAPALEVALRSVQEELAGVSGDGVFLGASEHEGWLLLGVPASAGDDETEWVYVFDTKTGAWTRWDVQASAVADAESRLYFGDANDGAVLRARLESDAYPHHDASFSVDSVTSATISEGVLNLVGVVSTGGTLSVGDWVDLELTPSGEALPTDVVGSVVAWEPGTASATVHITNPLVTINPIVSVSGTAYAGPACAIEWTARTAQNPLQTKFWADESLNFERLDSVARVGWEHRTDMQETATESEWLRFPEVARTRPEEWHVRGSVPREACRASQLLCKATISAPGGKWALTSLLVTYSAGGIRAGRRAS